MQDEQGGQGAGQGGAEQPQDDSQRRDPLKELQSRLEAAVEEVRPKLRRALDELDQKVDEAVAEIRPRAQNAMQEVRPKVDQLVADVQPRLDGLLDRLQRKIEDLRRDLDQRASRSSSRTEPAGQIPPSTSDTAGGDATSSGPAGGPGAPESMP